MLVKWRFKPQKGRRVPVCIWLIVLVLFSSFAFAEEQKDSSKAARYMVFPLKHITAEQGKKFLAQIGVGTVSELPTANTLLVTASPGELTKAQAIFKLVDSEKEFIIGTIIPAQTVGEEKGQQGIIDSLPALGKIAAQLGGNISIGTFADPPVEANKDKAIIDIHRGAVVAIATAENVAKIVSAIEAIKETKSETKTKEKSVAQEPNSPVKSPEIQPIPAETKAGESDVLFDKLIDSLAQAEEKAARNQKLREELDRAREFSAAPQDYTAAGETEVVADGLKGLPDTEPEKSGFIKRSYKPQKSLLAEEELELDLPETLDIVLLIDLVGKHLNLDLLYDPVEVKGTVSLRVQDKIKVGELYPLLESVLKFRGFVMSRKGNLVTIVPAAKVLDVDPTLLKDDQGQVQFGDVIVTRIFHLKYIDPTSAQNLLAGMRLGVTIQPVTDTGTLIVTEYAYRMQRIEELLEIVDIPGEPKEFRFRQLKYTLADSLAPKIKTLAEQLGTVSITISAPTRTAAPPKTTRGKRKPAPKKQPPQTAKTPSSSKPEVYLESDERTNRILMIGFEEQLEIVEGLIDTLDVEKQDLRTLRVYQIQYVGADEVTEKLEELGIITAAKTTSRRRSSRDRARQGRITESKKAAPAASAATTEEAPTEEPQVVLLESTNSLLVNATAEQHLQIATIIGYVDYEPEQATIPYEIYALENQTPQDLKSVLDELIEETITEKREKDSKVEETTTRKRLEEDIIIVADPTTFSLIVYANKKNQQWIRAIIEQLDAYPSQVLLDVTLVEISKTDQFTLDLDIVSKFPKLEPGEGMDKLTALLESSTTGFPSKRITEATVSSGSAQGFYADEHIQALLTAVQQKNYGRVLAKPKLLVNDNKSGTIQTTDTTYITRTETIIIPGDPPTQTESTTDKDYSAGITLTITPHISKGDDLLLDISLSRSDFGTITGDKPPDTANNNINTVITVPDNSTIILGGMERLNQSKGGTKTPLLGDIPLIGGLFRSTSNSDIQKRLYVFVKAHILRPGEEITGKTDLGVVSKKNRATFEHYEKEMQEYEDWPGIKPEPMDPLKILEAD